jgi:hypothetical protein
MLCAPHPRAGSPVGDKGENQLGPGGDIVPLRAGLGDLRSLGPELKSFIIVHVPPGPSALPAIQLRTQLLVFIIRPIYFEMSRSRTSSAPPAFRAGPKALSLQYSYSADTSAPSSPSSPPSLLESEGSTISSNSSDSGSQSPVYSASHRPPYKQARRPSSSVPGFEKYTRTFTSRLLGFPQTIVDPALVTSYCPCTGLSHTLWTPGLPNFFPRGQELVNCKIDTYIDPSCIIISIAGRVNSTGSSLTYGVFHGPGSPLNRSGSVPLSPHERTRTRLHAELYATELVLKQVLGLITEKNGEKVWPEARNVVLVTDSRRIMHALSSCVYTWKANGWTRARGKKAVANAAAWKAILELVEEVEARGVGVRVWTVSEAVNTDATMVAASMEGPGRKPLAQSHGFERKKSITTPPFVFPMPQSPCLQFSGWQGYWSAGNSPVSPTAAGQPNYGFPHAPYNMACMSCGRC